ncbi:hypothetical protein BD779DRAFT_817095 [Infundibulicybe gibba]|nr:hypothetical protein BD779DRAFT_817095 [Infundibulicybe gibba]
MNKRMTDWLYVCLRKPGRRALPPSYARIYRIVAIPRNGSTVVHHVQRPDRLLEHPHCGANLSQPCTYLWTSHMAVAGLPVMDGRETVWIIYEKPSGRLERYEQSAPVPFQTKYSPASPDDRTSDPRMAGCNRNTASRRSPSNALLECYLRQSHDALRRGVDVLYVDQ